MKIIKNPTKEAIDFLTEMLNIPELNAYSQDWECEAADSSRIKDFVEFYENKSLTDIEKYTLMSLIINSCNDAIPDGNFDNGLWHRVESLLSADKNICTNIIDYWACGEDDLEDSYDITPYIRKWKITNYNSNFALE